MRELTTSETNEVGGGVLPLIAFGLAVAGHVTGFAGVTTWAISATSLVGATYSASVYLGDLKKDREQ